MGETAFKEQHLQGLPISPGIAHARVCLLNEQLHSIPFQDSVSADQLPHEKERLSGAILRVTEKLERLIPQISERIGKAEANIFVALSMMVQDPELHKKMMHFIDANSCSAEAAVIAAFDEFAELLQSASDDYVKERVSDLTDLKSHLLKELGEELSLFKCNGLAHCAHGKNRIVIATELTPSITVNFDAYETLGFVSERGGETSHAAILARALGIPAVSGISGATSLIACGNDVLINGFTGEVILWPSPATIAAVADRLSATEPKNHVSEPLAEFTVMANISRVKELDDALDKKADGVGLYRTEMEFIAAGAALDEDEQFLRYAEVVRRLNGGTAYFRLLDVGGDKPFTFLEIPTEENPALGLRGARFLIKRPQFLRPQARALARASRLGPVSVMYPMISTLDQFLKLKHMFQSAIADVDHGSIQHGVLFEIPSACLQAREIMAEADFASIGTNDLVQYLLAVDRNNELVAQDYIPDLPAFWSLISLLVEAAAELKRPLSVCGELAGNPEYIQKFIELGIRCVSVNPRSIAPVRNAARDALRNM